MTAASELPATGPNNLMITVYGGLAKELAR
jgi:hypothetical protein